MKDILKQSHLAAKFDKKNSSASRFYGCYTSDFAQKWHEVFKVPAEGADQKIDFGVVNRPSKFKDVLERIQKTPTSFGDPYWTNY